MRNCMKQFNFHAKLNQVTAETLDCKSSTVKVQETWYSEDGGSGLESIKPQLLLKSTDCNSGKDGLLIFPTWLSQ